MKSIFFRALLQLGLVFLLVFTISCKKDSDTKPNPVTDPGPDTTQTSSDPSQYETPFMGIPATSDIVMYEINERAFSTSGTLAGIVPRLDFIRALGVNVIWLMPIHPIGVTNTVNSPYCVANYLEVNPEYGNLKDLRTLVREAHLRQMAVIRDWVANHTYWDTPYRQHILLHPGCHRHNIIHPAGTNWQDVANLNFDNAGMRQMISEKMLNVT